MAVRVRAMTKTNDKAGIDTIWFTRCAGGGRGGVPTASGIAYKLGYLDEEFKGEGLALKTLQEDASEELRRHHYDHELSNLIREGGNLFSIPAKAQGAKTRLIGLTWIDEAQSILVRQGSDIRSPGDLKGRKLALPAFRPADILENKRGRSIARHQSVAGCKGRARLGGPHARRHHAGRGRCGRRRSRCRRVLTELRAASRRGRSTPSS